MSRKPNKRKATITNRPELTKQEEEDAKYDALLRDLGAYDGDMTLQEKRDYYGALMASMGETNVNLSSPMIISESSASELPAPKILPVANNQCHGLFSEDESPTVPTHDSLQTSYGSLPEISSSPPPLEDAPMPIHPRRSNRYAIKANGVSLSAVKPPTLLIAEMEDLGQCSSIRARDTEATCNSAQKKSVGDTPVSEPSALEIKKRLAAFREMLEKKKNAGGTVVLLSSKELKNLDIDSIPEPCTALLLSDPIVLEEIQKLRMQLHANRIPSNPESLLYEEYVEKISKQKTPVKHVIFSREAKSRSFSKFWDSNKDLWEEVENSPSQESQKDQTVKTLRMSTRKQTVAAVRNSKVVSESSDDDFIVTKKARVKEDIKEKIPASKKPLDTEEENCDVGSEEGLEAENTGKKRSTLQSKQRASRQNSDKLKKNGKASNPKTKTGPKVSFVPSSKLTDLVSGETQSEQNAENFASALETVRCAGVDVEECLERPNLPEQLRKRLIASLIPCSYCMKPFLGSSFTEKEEHEKMCRLNQSLLSDVMRESVENKALGNGIQHSNGKQNRRDETESDGTAENMDIQVSDIRTSSPVFAKRSRTKR